MQTEEDRREKGREGAEDKRRGMQTRGEGGRREMG
jgi:hypothetical protein